MKKTIFLFAIGAVTILTAGSVPECSDPQNDAAIPNDTDAAETEETDMLPFDGMAGTTGSFPDTIANDDAIPGDHTGIPWSKRFADEWMGAMQAIIDGAGITPSGSADTATASDFRDAIAIMSGVGDIVGIPYDTIPANRRLLFCNGYTYPIADYPLLASVVLTASNDGTESAFYRTTVGGTPDPAGTYIKLPDYRGYFFRGRDVGGLVDPDGASRVWNAKQADSVGPHSHTGVFADPNYTDHEVEMSSTSQEGSGAGVHDVRESGGSTLYTGASGDNIDTESRPENRILKWCVKY